jgi:small nuclear ribonucleoprotein (snRNP)-like protein
MSLSWLGKLMPYFIAVKSIKRYNSENTATLQFKWQGKVQEEINGKVRSFDNGEYLFVSDVSELLQEKIKIKNKLREVEGQLEKYEKPIKMPGWND